MAAAPLELSRISAVSPSLSEVLRLCSLRAGLGRASGVDQFVLGNPKAWLGTAYHEVLAAAGQEGKAADVAAVWERVTDEHYQRAQQHSLDKRFGPPERWPGYHLIRAMALVRAAEIASQVKEAAGAARSAGTYSPSSGHERWLSAAGGQIVGRPDALLGDAVIDYKTGSVFEDGQNQVVKASYVRQLQLYAFLVKEATGSWPRRGLLLPMQGMPIEMQLDPTTCKQVAQEALELLDQYNKIISAENDAHRLANPSPLNCKWCQYQLLCPEFWIAADESWHECSTITALGGAATARPLPIHGGSALTLQLTVDEGTEPRSTVDLGPLLLATHSTLSKVQPATRIRAVGLARRLDGSLSPTATTVIKQTMDIPKIALPSPVAPIE